MNVQWSGKTLLSALSANSEAPTRSSTQRPGRLSIRTAPEPRPDGFGEISHRDNEPLGVYLDLELWEASRSRTSDGGGPVGRIENGLVAGTEELVGAWLVEADGASGVGADLRVRHDAVGRPALTARQRLVGAGFE